MSEVVLSSLLFVQNLALTCGFTDLRQVGGQVLRDILKVSGRDQRA
jgi:hypothetical protein